MAGFNFFKNYFYGKSDKRDFTEGDLPTNRLQLFKDVLMVRKGSMVGLNFLYLLIWLPAVVWSFINILQLQIQPPETLGSLLFTYLLLLVPMIFITGPFRIGISYVMRNWARDEHAFPFLHFKTGMKENWKQSLLISLVDGLLPLVVYVCVYFYAGMAKDSVVFYLPIAIVLIAALVWVLSAQLLPTLIVTYRLSFLQALRNAVLMTLAALPRAILIKLATLALPILTGLMMFFFPAALNYVLPISIVLYAVFMLSLNKLITASYANMLCEKYLNTKIEGAPVDIGLRAKDE